MTMVNRSQAPRGSPPLRDYQQDTVDKMLRYEGRAALCVLGTGLGKTRIFSEFVRKDVIEKRSSLPDFIAPGRTC